MTKAAAEMTLCASVKRRARPSTTGVLEVKPLKSFSRFSGVMTMLGDTGKVKGVGGEAKRPFLSWILEFI